MIDKLVVKLLTLKMWLSDDHGQDILEYAMLGGFIALALAAAFLLTPTLRTSLNNFALSLAHCIDVTVDPYKCP